MTTRIGRWFRRWRDRRAVQRRLAWLREEAAAHAALTPQRAKVAWMILGHVLDAPNERLPAAVRESPELYWDAHMAAMELYRAYRGYGPEPRRAA